MKKKVYLTLIVVMTSLALFSASALAISPGGPGEGAGRGPGGDPEMMAPGSPRLMQGLNLTDEQIEKLKKEKFAKRKNLIQMRAEKETLELDLEKELSADQPHTGKIDKIARKMGDLHGQMIAQRAQSLVFLKSLLTDEQKKILDAHQLAPGHHGMKMMKHRSRGKGQR